MYEKQSHRFTFLVYVVIFLCVCICTGLLYLSAAKGVKQQSINAITQPPLSALSTLPEKSEEPVMDEKPEIILDDITSMDSMTCMLNQLHKADPEYVPADLSEVNVPSNGKIMLRAEVAEKLQIMFDEAKKDGIDLYLVSGYRSYQKQTELYTYYSKLYGEQEASRMDAVPGISEHMLGLSVDLCTTDHTYELQDGFSTTKAYEWLCEHAYEYGYILRYPLGKEEATGIEFSPWSFRYVGTSVAKRIYESGLSMEEYYEVSVHE